VHSFLGSHVSQTNRTKIVSGQYIDLTILSENTNSENNDKQVVLIDGVLSTKEKNKQTIHTIEKWTDACIVYKGNNKITELRTISQRESQNS
jgi:orotate phosphoribosyltransferase-like protein